MSLTLNCPACSTRLKLPPGPVRKKGRCPNCDASIDLSAALGADTYRPRTAGTVLPPGLPPSPPPVTPDTTPAPAPPAEREEDPLPYRELVPKPAPSTAASSDPRPEPATPVLSLDDDTRPLPASSPPQPSAVPLRVQARLVTDSAGQFAGPCEVVLVPHGLFLESVRYRPFLYVPVPSVADSPAPGLLTITLPDSRTLALELLGRHSRRLAEDLAAFLSGERGVPRASEYSRLRPGLFGLALLLALGLGIGPFVTARAYGLPPDTAWVVAAGFAGLSLTGNLAVVLLSRRAVVAQVVMMSGIGIVVTGVFLLAASAYQYGRRQGEQAARAEFPAEPESRPTPWPEPAPPRPDQPAPGTVRGGPPTAIDLAYREGAYRFEEGPDEVTVAGFTPDGQALILGYKNGVTRVWHLDQPTFDPPSNGPRTDGPPTRIQFDATGTVCYLTCNGGTVASVWNDPAETPLKIPGEMFVAFPSPGGERFATVRGNGVAVRYVPTGLTSKPLAKSPGFVATTPKDEVLPANTAPLLTGMGGRLTFLAWQPTGRLLGGLADGSILTWTGSPRTSLQVVSRDHKAAVRAWATCAATGDFATGDDKGTVGVWAYRSAAPRTFRAAEAAITQLAFSPSGVYLVVADGTNVVRVWDLFSQRAVVKTIRPNPVRAVAAGPNDDLVLLAEGKSAELWHLDELAKQP